jgi:hypothetical protein
MIGYWILSREKSKTSHKLLAQTIDNSNNQIGFGGEVVVECRVVNPSSNCDIASAKTLDAVLSDCVIGRFHQGRPAVDALTRSFASGRFYATSFGALSLSQHLHPLILDPSVAQPCSAENSLAAYKRHASLTPTVQIIHC